MREPPALFRTLLALYPRAFRERFAEGMAYAFARDLERARAAGAARVALFWMRTVASMVWNGIAERRAGTGSANGLEGMGGGGIMDTFTRELRQAARRLRRRPGFTFTSVLTLALGIGATTAIYSVIHAVVLQPMPYQDGDRLVMVGHESATDRLGMPAGGFLHYAERSQTVAEWGLWIEESTPIAGTGEPLELHVIHASNGLLPLLRVEPILGRGFAPEDHLDGAEPVVIVSHGFWVRHLGADPGAVGGEVWAGSGTRVVGVLPEGFAFMRPEALVVFGNRFDAPDIFMPLEALEPANARFGNFMYHSMGRLAPGYSVEDAQREAGVLMHEATEAYPGGLTSAELEDNGFRPAVASLKAAMVGDVSRVLWILLGAVVLVLGIALANVANLFLVRAESRTGEMALRGALGADRAAIALAFLTESLLLAVGGGVVGLVLASVGTEALTALVPHDVPRLGDAGLAPAVVSFALLVTAASAVLLSAVPMRWRRGRDLRAALAEEGRGSPGGRSRLRSALMTAQVALALVLLVGSGLLVQTFQSLRAVDPGFDPARALTLRLSLSGSILRAAGLSEGLADVRRSAFMLGVTERLATLPGVEAVGFSADLPLDGDEWHDAVVTEDAMRSDHAAEIKTQRVFVGPGYLSAIGARVLRGRELERADFADQPRVVVVNEGFAEQRWPGEDPLGRRLAQHHRDLNPDDDVWYTVVGVVEDIREASLMTPPEPTVYLPTVFLPEGDFFMWVSNLVVVVRTTGEPMGLLPRVREEILAYRSDVPINDVATLETITARSFAEVSFAMTLVIIAAVAALLLGVVGIYGTVSHVVGRRTREFGLRIALGASAAEVSRGVLRDSGRVGLLGIALGLAGAAASSQALGTLVYGVSGVEPVIYAGVAVLLLVVVLVAALVPARRASRIDPVEALRAE